MSDHEQLAELRRHLDRQGGRGVELAEEIDDLACKLGQCVYTLDECRRETHEGYSSEASEQWL